jgi:hypothetical protein
LRCGIAALGACTLAVFGALSVGLVGEVPAHADASAVIPDSGFSDFNSVTFGPSDDGSWPCGPSDASEPVQCPVDGQNGPEPYPFGFNLNFYGTEYGGAYVNSNGNITFGNYLSTYTPFGLTSTDVAIIAPFFADVDTHGGNIMEIGTGTLDGHDVFVVDWPGVGCYNADQSVTDDFQVILIDRPDLGTGALGDDFQIEFNYDSIQWDAGEASFGDNPPSPTCTGAPDQNSAVVGFSNGTSTPGDSYQLPGSQMSGAFLDSNLVTGLIYNDVNSDVPGRYIFTVNAGQPLTPTTVATSLSGGSQTGPSISVPPSTAVTDSATLSGTNAATATGTVTYDVYSDSACTDAVSTGSPDTITTPGTLPPSSAVTLNTPGTYYWQASYTDTGDPLNASSMSTCGSEIETVTAPTTTTPTTLTTTLSGGYQASGGVAVLENTGVTDSATLSGTNAATATGTVTYDVYSDSACTTAVSTGTPENITTPGTLPASSPFYATTPGTYYWQASYSGDSENSSSMSTCGSEIEAVGTATALPTPPTPIPPTPTPTPPTPTPPTPTPTPPAPTPPAPTPPIPTPTGPKIPFTTPLTPGTPLPTVTPPPTQIVTPPVSQSKSLVLTRATLIPGETTTANGVGCAPGSQVVIAVGGTTIAETTANSQGDFSALITPPDQGAARLTVTATCGSTQLATLLSLVSTATVSTPEGGAGVFCVFVLLGAVLLRGQFTSNVTRRRGRRRRRGAADILENLQP